MARVQKELCATVFMTCLEFCATGVSVVQRYQQSRAISGTVVMHSFSIQRARLLQRAFFSRDPREVGSELLGKIIVRRERRSLRAGRIVEVEAYLETGDLAAHAAAGQTARNAVIFGLPGHAYVYFIYGVHYCLNISCMPKGEAGCVLIRALEPVAGIDQMTTSRGFDGVKPDSVSDLRRLTSGPGRLCEALEITRPRDNGKNMVSAQSDLQVMDDGFLPEKVQVTPRIGITKSPDMPLRYCIAQNPFVSKNLTADLHG